MMAVAAQTMTIAVAAERVHETPARVRERPAALPAVTGLRALLALWVVLFHAGLWRLGVTLTASGPVARPGLLGGLSLALVRGYAAVTIFFMLSGFVLAYSYLDPAIGGRLRTTARRFLVARFARVYPIYALALLVSAVPLLLDGQGLAHARLVVPATLLLMQSWLPLGLAAQGWNGPGWSLSVEAFCYLLFPLMGPALARLGRRGLLGALAGCWGLSMALPALYGAVFAHGPADMTIATAPMTPAVYWAWVLMRSPLVHLPEFVAGVALGCLLRRGALSPVACRLSPGLWAPAALCGATIIVSAPHLPWLSLHNGLLAPLAAALIVALATGRGSIAGMLAHPAAVTLGEASYALYLLHAPLWDLLGRAVPAPAPSSLCFVPYLCSYSALALAVALVAHRVVEQPGRRLILSRPGPAAARPAAAGCALRRRHRARRSSP